MSEYFDDLGKPRSYYHTNRGVDVTRWTGPDHVVKNPLCLVPLNRGRDQNPITSMVVSFINFLIEKLPNEINRYGSGPSSREKEKVESILRL